MEDRVSKEEASIQCGKSLRVSWRGRKKKSKRCYLLERPLCVDWDGLHYTVWIVLGHNCHGPTILQSNWTNITGPNPCFLQPNTIARIFLIDLVIEN